MNENVFHFCRDDIGASVTVDDIFTKYQIEDPGSCSVSCVIINFACINICYCAFYARQVLYIFESKANQADI